MKCLESGNWSASRPTCDEILCSPLASPLHGSVEYSVGPGVNITNGTLASVSCHNGYYYNLTSGNVDVLCLYGISFLLTNSLIFISTV